VTDEMRDTASDAAFFLAGTVELWRNLAIILLVLVLLGIAYYVWSVFAGDS
jgi:hypothetical protein